MAPSSGTRSDGLGPPLPRANADAVVHWQDEDLAVTDLSAFSGTAALEDRIDGGLDKLLVDGDL